MQEQQHDVKSLPIDVRTRLGKVVILPRHLFLHTDFSPSSWSLIPLDRSIVAVCEAYCALCFVVGGHCPILEGSWPLLVVSVSRVFKNIS